MNDVINYFVKWLPVNEPLKEGDITLWHNSSPINVINELIPFLSNKNAKPWKLFLCSKDNYYLKSSSDIILSHLNGDNVETKLFTDNNYINSTYFKIIAEISKEAIWVNDGDRLTNDDIELWVNYGKYQYPYINGNENYDYIFAKIKSTQCKCFH